MINLEIAVSPERCMKVLKSDGFRPHPTIETWGPSGFIIRTSRMSPIKGQFSVSGSVIVTQAPFDGIEWIHASVSWQGLMPTYQDLTTLKFAVFGPKRHAYQIFPDSAEHVNIHEYSLHLWGRADGQRALPNFTEGVNSI